MQGYVSMKLGDKHGQVDKINEANVSHTLGTKAAKI